MRVRFAHSKTTAARPIRVTEPEGGFRPAPKPSAVFGDNLRVARGQKGWTQQDLADAMARAGRPIDRSAIARLEAREGTRAENVSLNEVLAFAAVLCVSPLHLVVPWDDTMPVAVTKEPFLARRVRDWMRGGRHPLTGADERFYFFFQPPGEWRPTWMRRRPKDATREQLGLLGFELPSSGLLADEERRRRAASAKSKPTKPRPGPRRRKQR